LFQNVTNSKEKCPRLKNKKKLHHPTMQIHAVCTDLHRWQAAKRNAPWFKLMFGYLQAHPWFFLWDS